MSTGVANGDLLANAGPFNPTSLFHFVVANRFQGVGLQMKSHIIGAKVVQEIAAVWLKDAHNLRENLSVFHLIFEVSKGGEEAEYNIHGLILDGERS